MKALTSTKQILTALLVTILLYSCNQQPIDPSTTLDDVFIPNGFVQTDDFSVDMKTRLDELRLENPDDQFYYLKLKDGPIESKKELIFPQNELKIEVADGEWNSNASPKYHGVIVKKIKGKWTDEIFMEFCDKTAEPKGGMEAFRALVSENLKYPQVAKDNKIEGRVFVQFIVKKDGTVTEVQAVKGIGAGCDEEAERFILNETSWIPAQVANENVNSRTLLPLVFKLD